MYCVFVDGEPMRDVEWTLKDSIDRALAIAKHANKNQPVRIEVRQLLSFGNEGPKFGKTFFLIDPEGWA